MKNKIAEVIAKILDTYGVYPSCYVADEILALIAEELPKEKEDIDTDILGYDNGYNQALKEVKQGLLEGR